VAQQRDQRSQTSTGDPRGLGVHRAGTGRRRPGPGCARSRREAGATLGATGLDDGSAGSGRHPVPKPVALRPLPGVRLVGALHAVMLPSIFRPTRPHESAMRNRPGPRRT
jgi:hypothetical protein